MIGIDSSEDYLRLARGLALLHMIIVAITVAGGVALFTGRFRRFHVRDIFAWVFIACSFGQVLSLVLTGGCILTTWQRDLLLRAGQDQPFSGTFLQQYLPWLPDVVATRGVPLLTLGALIGAGIQAVDARRGSTRSRSREPDASAERE